jgi:excisionase family DNA binding protein
MRTSDPVLSAREIAEFLGLNYETVLDYLAAGKLRGVKRGKRWYIRQSALDAFLEPDTRVSA